MLTHSDLGNNIEYEQAQFNKQHKKLESWGPESNYRPGGGGVNYLAEHGKM